MPAVKEAERREVGRDAGRPVAAAACREQRMRARLIGHVHAGPWRCSPSSHQSKPIWTLRVNHRIDDGQVLELATPHAVASGGGVKIGTIFGVARVGAAQGVTVEVATAGIHELPKVAAQAWAAGDAVFWDDNLKLCTTTAAGNTRIGVAAAAAGKPSARGRVRLDGTS
jgi:predicted RecA/RadA family phage recombinase